MSGREWKPGDVVMVTEYDEPLLAMVGYREGSKLLTFKYANGGFDVAGRIDIGDGEELDIAARPLVVIDPEGREQVERLLADHKFAVTEGMGPYDAMSWALRQFANPKPPKPEEPTGRYAVVVDDDGTEWLRKTADGMWCSQNETTERGVMEVSYKHYENIAAARVLSEGVQAGDPR